MTEEILNERFIIEPASVEDGREIIEILEEEAAPGNPSLFYTRRPNAVLSMKKEGEHVSIMVCRSRTNNEIAGFGAYSINRCFLDGKARPVAYLFGLRCRKKYRYKAGRMIPEIYSRIRIELESQAVDHVITTILSENMAARHLLTRPHVNMPQYLPLGKYEVFAVDPRKQRHKKLPEGIACEPARIAGKERLREFLETESCKRNFYPLIKDSPAVPEDFFEECLVLYDQKDGTVLAAGYCRDQRSYKQYVVAGYSGIYRLLTSFSSVLCLCGYPRLPSVGETLNIRTLSFSIVRDERKEYFDWFIDALSGRFRDAAFILIGAGPQYPHISQLETRPHWKYTSDIYAVVWDKESEVFPGVPSYLQCGWL
jgi:hypothetical protein